MLSRTEILKVTKSAARVLDDFDIRNSVLHDGFTRVDPVRLAERAGVHVMYRPLNKLLGAFIRETQPGILLNTQRSAGMIHMTCAHELGHFFLNHATTADERLDYGKGAGKHELEADQFAYALIAPAWLLAHVVRTRGWGPKLHDPRVVYQLSLRLGLSYEATVWTLVRQKKIDSSTANQLKTQRPIAIKRSMLPPDQTVDASQDVWVLNLADRDCVLQPRVGDRFLMTLPDHGSTGFLWEAQDVRAAGYTLRSLAVEPARDDQVWVGAEQQVFFEVEVEGFPSQVQLDLHERQPWQTFSPTSAELTVVAQFESVDEGLASNSRKRLIEDFRG